MSDMPERFTVTIEPGGWTFEACAGMPLLEAAKLAHVGLPSSCRNGTCRACMCRMTSGTVQYRIEWPGLSADEKEAGFILPCVAYPQAALAIVAPEAVDLRRVG
jgi:ferredoxin